MDVQEECMYSTVLWLANETNYCNVCKYVYHVFKKRRILSSQVHTGIFMYGVYKIWMKLTKCTTILYI